MTLMWVVVETALLRNIHPGTYQLVVMLREVPEGGELLVGGVDDHNRRVSPGQLARTFLPNTDNAPVLHQSRLRRTDCVKKLALKSLR